MASVRRGLPIRRRLQTPSPVLRLCCWRCRERRRRRCWLRSATALAGKVVIDASNDIQGTGKLHALAELTDGAHPVRAFNTLGWENFADPVFDGVTADLFYAAEEGNAKEVADRLIADVGLRPVWLGGVDAFDLVDSLTRLWFTLASSANSAAGSRSRCWAAANEPSPSGLRDPEAWKPSTPVPNAFDSPSRPRARTRGLSGYPPPSTC